MILTLNNPTPWAKRRAALIEMPAHISLLGSKMWAENAGLLAPLKEDADAIRFYFAQMFPWNRGAIGMSFLVGTSPEADLQYLSNLTDEEAKAIIFFAEFGHLFKVNGITLQEWMENRCGEFTEEEVQSARVLADTFLAACGVALGGEA